MADLALVEAPNETARAREAFAEYVAMGPDRSLRKLAERHGKTRSYVVQLERWSSEHHWQDRIKALATEQIERASEFRAGTYVAITQEYYKRVVEDEPMRHVMQLDALNSIFDRVKPKESLEVTGKGGGPITLAFYDRTDGPS